MKKKNKVDLDTCTDKNRE